MAGFSVSEEGHVVHVYPSNDPTGAVEGDIFRMENWAHASILVLKGAGSAATITVEESTGFGGTSATAIPFNYYLESTAAGILWRPRPRPRPPGWRLVQTLA